MKKAIGFLVALLSAAIAVVLMVLPTYTTSFGAQGGGRGFETHRWFDPFLLVYLDVVPALSLICGTVMVVGLSAGLVRGRVPGWLVIPGIAAAILLLLFGYDVNASGFVSGAGRLVAPLLAASSVFAAIIWLLDRRSAQASV